MGQRVKVLDLVDTKDRDWPLLLFKGTVFQGSKPVLHICRRSGQLHVHSKLVNPYRHYHITDCNRPLKHVSYFHDSASYLTFDHFRLCARCGDREGFEQAFEQMEIGWAARRAELAAEDAVQIASRQRVWEEKHARLEAFREVLEIIDSYNILVVGEIEADSNTLSIWYDGGHFTIEEDPES